MLEFIQDIGHQEVISWFIPVIVAIFAVLISINRKYGDKLKRTIGEIGKALDYYADVYTIPKLEKNDISDEASNKIRDLATTLISDFGLIKCYWLVRLLYSLPKNSNLKEAKSILMFLHHDVYASKWGNENNQGINNGIRAERIKRLLRIPFDTKIEETWINSQENAKKMFPGI